MTGAILAIGAVGVTLVLGVLRLLHVAHGDTLVVGAYLGLGATAVLGGNLWLGAVVAVLGTAALSVLLDRIVWRPLRETRAGFVSLLLTSIGLALVLRHVVLLVAGAQSQQFPFDVFRVYEVAGIRLSQSQLVALVVAVVSIAGVAFLFARTALGKAMRALSDNPELAAVAGIDVDRTIVMIWVLSGGLAGLAGVLQGMVQNAFDPNFGFELLLPIFAAVILGGIGSAYGALVGGMVLGIVMEASTWSGLLGGVPPAYKQVVAFTVLVAMLLVRPQGMFGKVTLR